jgi:beta-glucuronidase
VIAGDARGHTAAEAADFVAVNIYPGVFDPVPAYHISEFAVTVTTKAAEVLSQQVNYYRDKPVVVTEFGCHAIRGLSGDVRFSEDYQARYIQAMWQAITHVQGVQGGVLWCWADYYHRRGFLNTGFNAEYGPFGVVTIDRQPKKSYQALSGMFGGST